VRAGLIGLPVIDSEDDDGLRSGEDELEIGAAVSVAFEPGHVAGAAFLEPGAEVARVRRRDGGRDLAEIESQGFGVGDQA
jgi:hypothetical protein